MKTTDTEMKKKCTKNKTELKYQGVKYKWLIYELCTPKEKRSYQLFIKGFI